MIPSSDWLDEAACSAFELDTNLFLKDNRAGCGRLCSRFAANAPYASGASNTPSPTKCDPRAPPQYGIFGGLTPTERRELWQERRDIMKDLEKRTRELAEKVEKIKRSQGK